MGQTKKPMSTLDETQYLDPYGPLKLRLAQKNDITKSRQTCKVGCAKCSHDQGKHKSVGKVDRLKLTG